MTLEALLQEAATKGGLRGLTLWKTTDGYQANLSLDGKSWRVEHDADPATALRKVLGAKSAPVDDIFA